MVRMFLLADSKLTLCFLLYSDPLSSSILPFLSPGNIEESVECTHSEVERLKID